MRIKIVAKIINFFPFSFDESSEAGDKPEAADEADDEDDNNKWKRRRRRRPKAARPTSRRTSRRLPSSSSDYESEDFEGPEIVIDSNTSTDDDLDDENGIGGTYKREDFYFYLCDVHHSVLECMQNRAIVCLNM